VDIHLAPVGAHLVTAVHGGSRVRGERPGVRFARFVP
jgi:hypothetical protein